jgi:hypothetical protein
MKPEGNALPEDFSQVGRRGRGGYHVGEDDVADQLEV